MARAIPEAVLKNVDKLEPLPVTAQALMKAISDGDASFAKLAGLIELDQAVAANVLRISRSAAYAGRSPVTTALSFGVSITISVWGRAMKALSPTT